MRLSTTEIVTATLCLLSIASIGSAVTFDRTARARFTSGQEKASLQTVVRQLRSCNEGSDCDEDDDCINASGLCLDDDCNGVCNTPEICNEETPCPEGQVCLRTIDPQSHTDYTSCFPESDVPALSDIAKPVAEPTAKPTAKPAAKPTEESASGEEVCVAIEMLQGLKAHELVFEKNVLARVFCDAAGSCATRGHVVNYQGKAMMMGSYCDVVGCEERIMKVNSPKHRRGLKVQSLSEDMHFTAFAARYGTAAEEAFFAAAVWLGL